MEEKGTVQGRDQSLELEPELWLCGVHAKNELLIQLAPRRLCSCCLSFPSQTKSITCSGCLFLIVLSFRISLTETKTAFYSLFWGLAF